MYFHFFENILFIHCVYVYNIMYVCMYVCMFVHKSVKYINLYCYLVNAFSSFCIVNLLIINWNCIPNQRQLSMSTVIIKVNHYKLDLRCTYYNYNTLMYSDSFIPLLTLPTTLLNRQKIKIHKYQVLWNQSFLHVCPVMETQQLQR